MSAHCVGVFKNVKYRDWSHDFFSSIFPHVVLWDFCVKVILWKIIKRQSNQQGYCKSETYSNTE